MSRSNEASINSNARSTHVSSSFSAKESCSGKERPTAVRHNTTSVTVRSSKEFGEETSLKRRAKKSSQPSRSAKEANVQPLNFSGTDAGNFGESPANDTRRLRCQPWIDSHSSLNSRMRFVREMICSERFAFLAKDSPKDGIITLSFVCQAVVPISSLKQRCMR